MKIETKKLLEQGRKARQSELQSRADEEEENRKKEKRRIADEKRKYIDQARKWVEDYLPAAIKRYAKEELTGPLSVSMPGYDDKINIPQHVIATALLEVEDIEVHQHYQSETQCDHGGDCMGGHNSYYYYTITWEGQPPSRRRW